MFTRLGVVNRGGGVVGHQVLIGGFSVVVVQTASKRFSQLQNLAMMPTNQEVRPGIPILGMLPDVIRQ